MKASERPFFPVRTDADVAPGQDQEEDQDQGRDKDEDADEDASSASESAGADERLWHPSSGLLLDKLK